MKWIRTLYFSQVKCNWNYQVNAEKAAVVSVLCVLIQEADDTTVKSNDRMLMAVAGGAAPKLSSLVNGVDSPRYDRRYRI